MLETWNHYKMESLKKYLIPHQVCCLALIASFGKNFWRFNSSLMNWLAFQKVVLFKKRSFFHLVSNHLLPPTPSADTLSLTQNFFFFTATFWYANFGSPFEHKIKLKQVIGLVLPERQPPVLWLVEHSDQWTDNVRVSCP